MFFVGLALGVVYEICFFIRKLFPFKIFTIIFDILFVFISFIVVLFAINFCAYGELRLYLFLGVFFGFFVERVSIGFLVAKSLNFIYNNFIVKLINKLKQFKGKHRGRKKVKKDC